MRGPARDGATRPTSRGLSSREQVVEQVAAQVAAQELYRKAINRWRDQLNPLRGLTIARAIQYLEAGKRGEYADLQWLFDHVEERDPTLIALIERYEGGLAGMDVRFHQVTDAEMPRGGSTQLAEEQAAALREAYDGVGNLREALNFLMLARFRGYAHLEKHYGPDGSVVHLEPVPQWYWVRDGINGDWEYNQEARSGTRTGLPIDDRRDDFVIREKKRPVNLLGLLHYVYRNLGVKDWAGFVETYGIPPLFLIQPPNIPPDRAAEYQAIAEAIIGDARGSLPNGSEVKSVEAGGRNQNPFRDFLTFLKEEVVLAGTGGKLTMLAESGSGTLAGSAHQDAWDEIVEGEAGCLSEVLQRQFDSFVLVEQFPGRPVLAKFMLGPGGEEEEEKNFKRDVWKGFLADKTVADMMANLVSLRELTTQVGLPTNEEYDEPYLPVKDEQGNVVTGDVVRDAQGDIVGGDSQAGDSPAQGGGTQAGGGAPSPSPRPSPSGEGGTTADAGAKGDGAGNQAAAPAGARASRIRITPYSNRLPVSKVLLATGTDELARAVASDLAPVRKRLAAILEIKDAEILRNRLLVFRADLEGLKQDINQDPEAARALERVMSEALIQGLKAKG